MTFRFVLPESRPLLGPPTVDGTGSIEWQIATLRADYGRASRLLIGIAATLVLVIAIFLVYGLVGAVGLANPFAAVTAIPLAALGAGAAWLLLGLHRSGRRLSVALADRLSAAVGSGGSIADVVLARTFILEPFIVWRIAAASLSLLFGVLSASIVFKPMSAGDPSEIALTAAAASIGALLIVVGCGVFGGVFRVHRAHSRRDPVQRRILGG
ncbi:hypothetical protein [Agromyces lapidis]|uniref:RDD domain-containing protein n=1 Tax=Agromyces lapidis TaxID=279574 RepID=A0ABV5SPI7_9MICO|nr:hypothetical protein [Agromyces lapidis]